MHPGKWWKLSIVGHNHFGIWRKTAEQKVKGAMDAIQELKSEIPPTLEMVPDLKKNGHGFNGPCPKCGGHDRFIVWPDGHFFCRQCDFKGDNLDLYCEQKGTTIKELLEVNFQELFDSQVKPNLPQKAIQLFEKRGLAAIVPYLLANRFVGWHAKENSITFALFHPKTGDIVGIQRIPVAAGKKKAWHRSNMADGVLVIPGDPGAPEIIVEGVFDGLSARLVGEYTIVIIFSASTVKKLSLLTLKNPILFFDNDAAGGKATEKAAAILPNAKTVDWELAPDGCKDVNDLLRGGHQEVIAKMVDTAKNYRPKAETDFQWECLADLQHKDFPEPKWIIPGFLAEGSTILGAKPKIGKSTFAANIALSVATGGKALGQFDVEMGSAFYISLDDTSERRLKHRIEKMLPGLGVSWPEKFRYTTKFPKADEGGLDVLRGTVERYPDTRIVIIDTMHKFLSGKRSISKNAYEIDTDRLTPIAEFATTAGICILLIHHTTKTKYLDPFDMLSGSIGVQGAVDDLMVMDRDHTGFKLSMRGRTLEDRTVVLDRDPATYTWFYKGEASEVMATDYQQTILDTLKDADESMSPSQIKEKTGYYAKTIKRILAKLCTSGLIEKVGYGQYAYKKK